ncbi:GNAT family N-acetyltransferase [Tsukamurella ocularis]|uniref:GNAT family N-acetyltransferase n=1 Tax=Tsukamurella ocularis TaxID=1970234 RepID=UPI00216A604C|nr:GNAT family N-acetyltransferase [Tsukamurella ocularis]MCS3780874.1 aminoglycoside 6'-N-acetyltransferase [Tsukamurella ocularis]MCS3786698.1 aminoglycoside 6'-N-acetyltransferase [Tsukamurella ocularis]MCS3850540.1 aminoglycoside 6'-N-acetyltransferase [Tsukamurella ocularis]
MIAFRRVTRDDFPLLASWLGEPHNRRWWHHETSPEAIERDFGPSVDGAEPSQDWLGLDDAGVPFGLIQRQRWVDYADEAETAAVATLVDLGPADYGVDYLIGAPSATGRGLGTAMIAAMCSVIFTELGGERVVVAVAAGNRRSWRALERAGFVLVGHVDIPPDNPVDPPDHVVYALSRPA